MGPLASATAGAAFAAAAGAAFAVTFAANFAAAFAATFAAGAQNAGYAAVVAFASGGAEASAGDDLDLRLVFLTSDCSGLRSPFLILGAGAGSVAYFASPLLLDRVLAFIAADGSDAALASICLPVSLRFIAAALLSAFGLIRGGSDAALGVIPALRDLDFCAAGPDDDAAAGSNFDALSPHGAWCSLRCIASGLLSAFGLIGSIPAGGG